ncbi:MAG: phosphotransacetylase [candidate division Zixibacteria bacterium]|nr:phosphotransacetylase [candidate division Zixibacteria bacterium]
MPKAARRTVVFSEGDNERIMRAALEARDEGICQPILLSKRGNVERMATEWKLDLNGIEIIDPEGSPHFESYVQRYWKKCERKGATLDNARKALESRTYFGMMMVAAGHADALLAGVTKHYSEVIRPAIRVCKLRKGIERVAGVYMIALNHDIYFFADTTVNIDPSAEQLAEIAVMTAEVARRFSITPRVALLSFSNFGSARSIQSDKVARAVALVKARSLSFEIDGEMQVDLATMPELLQRDFPFSDLSGKANVFIFPDLNSGNIAYKLMQRLAGADVIGPILMGLDKPIHVLQRNSSVSEIVDMAAIATVDAEWLGRR